MTTPTTEQHRAENKLANSRVSRVKKNAAGYLKNYRDANKDKIAENHRTYYYSANKEKIQGQKQRKQKK
jgi:type III secretory pathway component EscR